MIYIIPQPDKVTVYFETGSGPNCRGRGICQSSLSRKPFPSCLQADLFFDKKGSLHFKIEKQTINSTAPSMLFSEHLSEMPDTFIIPKVIMEQIAYSANFPVLVDSIKWREKTQFIDLTLR